MGLLKEGFKELFSFKKKYSFKDLLFAHFIVFLMGLEVYGWLFLTKEVKERYFITDLVFLIIPVILMCWIHIASQFKLLKGQKAKLAELDKR